MTSANVTPSETAQGWITQWDENGDGHLTLPEFSEALVRSGVVEAAAGAAADSTAPGAEDEAAIEALFRELDLDGDGYMTRVEMRDALKKLRHISESFDAERKAHETVIELTQALLDCS